MNMVGLWLLGATGILLIIQSALVQSHPATDHCSHRPMCKMWCETGFKKGPDGCDICECATAEPPINCPPICRMFCPFGFKKDSFGCDICQCALPDCSGRPICRKYCRYGFRKGIDGCDLCQCAAGPVRRSAVDCSGRPVCRMSCQFGFKKGPDGCDICECADERFVQCSPICGMACFFGFKKDRNGCDVCRCNTQPESCHYRPDSWCDKTCPRGYQSDQNGCFLCQCLPAVPGAPKDILCSLPAQSGPCQRSTTRWFYNKVAHRCETFIYGGCQGNQNNFVSEEICQRFC